MFGYLRFLLTLSLLAALLSACQPACGIDYDPQGIEGEINGQSFSAAAPESQVIYFLSRDATGNLDPRISPACQEEITGAKAVYNWDELLQAEKEKPIAALILHESAAEMADSDWLSQHFWDGMVVAAINIPADLLAKLLQNSGISESQYNPEEKPFYIIAAGSVTGDDPEEVARIITGLASSEEPVDGILGHVATFQRGSYGKFDDQPGVEGFASLLLDYLRKVGP